MLVLIVDFYFSLIIIISLECQIAHTGLQTVWPILRFECYSFLDVLVASSQEYFISGSSSSSSLQSLMPRLYAHDHVAPFREVLSKYIYLIIYF